MQFFGISIIVVTLSLVLVPGQSDHVPVRTSSHVEIMPTPEGNGNSTGNIMNARNCGGLGKVISWRYATCTNSEGLCKVPGDGIPRGAELEFVPSEDIPSLGNRLVLIHNGTVKTVLEQTIAKSEVKRGHHYTIFHMGAAKKELIGQIITIQNIVYRMDNEREACVEADLEVV